jgi:signal transduction histidine kinase
LKNQAIYPTADADGWLQLGGTTLFPLVKQAGGYAQSDMGGYQTLIRWRKNHKPFSIFSVADLLEGKIDPVKLKDKIVIVGSTAPSSNDTFLTPLVSPPTRLYGVEIHAHVLSQILAAALDDRPLLQATPVVNQNAFFLVVALGTAGVLPFVGKSTTLTHFFWKKGQFVVLILLLVSLFGVYSFVFSHYWLPLVSSYVFILLYGIFDAFLGFYGCHTEALESEVKQVAGELADAHRLLLEQSLAGAVEQIRGALIQEIGPNLRDLSIDIQSVQQEPYSNNLESKLINLETSLERIKNLVTYIVPAFNAVGDDAIPVYNYQQWLESIVRLTVSHRRRQSYILENIETTVCCSPELEQSAISLPQYLPVIIFAFLDNAFDACLSKLRLIELEEKLHIDVYIELIDDYLTISVEDNGQKVPDAIAETLFQPFVSEKGSFGLGLYLAQKFVQEHNGSIFYQDCGESKKFTVKILIKSK